MDDPSRMTHEKSVSFGSTDPGADLPHEHPPSPPPPMKGSPSSYAHARKNSLKDSPSFQSKSLRSNLMREQHGRDPLFFYEIVKTLGVGSMGSVAKVQKRAGAVGGSARKNVQEAVRRQKKEKECLQIPILGWFFKFCVDGVLKPSEPEREQRTSTRSWSEDFSTSSLIRPKSDLFMTASMQSTSSEVSDTLSTMTGQSINSKVYAMKSIHLNRVTDAAFVTELKNEIAILKKLDHPHIVRAMETFEHRNQIFIVMELCNGGDLYSRDPYTEEAAARIVSSILSAISYMHAHNMAHRDLKYENILFVNDSPTAEVKLIDFGLSKVYGDNAQLTEGVGTIYTMAPEVLKGNYTQISDVWSIGVIAYMLLSSQMPFYGRKRRHIVEQILNGQYDFRGRRWKRVSDQAKDFIKDLLVLDPDDRLKADEALRCVWLNRRFAATTRAPHAEEESTARYAMLRYAGYTKLKKMALMVVAHKSSTEEIGILRKLFQKFDSQGDGSISYEEFCEALADAGHSEEDLKCMFEAVDLDGSGRIRYTEFLAATIEAQGAISEERLADAFDRIDADDSGYIDAANLAEMLGHDFPKEEIEAIIQEADLSKDNRITYSDFLTLWETKHETERQEQLMTLGDPRISFEMDMNMCVNGSFLGEDIADDVQAAVARASFIQAKHKPEHDKHVIFTDTVISITDDNVVAQEVMDDAVVDRLVDPCGEPHK